METKKARVAMGNQKLSAEICSVSRAKKIIKPNAPYTKASMICILMLPIVNHDLVAALLKDG